jgi:tetratricopeptide (TPR) repeat protein
LSGSSEPVGSIDVALAHVTRLLTRSPSLAAEQASEILKTAPGHPAASLLLGVARRAMGDTDGALALFELLTQSHPRWAVPHYELSRTLQKLGRRDAAKAALERCVEVKPDFAWRALGDRLTAIGDVAGADQAYLRQIKESAKDPRLVEAADHMQAQRLAPAEALLREHLQQYPTEVAALRMLAEVGMRLGRNGDAEALLARTLQLAPSFISARHQYAVALQRQNKLTEALAQVEHLLAIEPRNPSFRTFKATLRLRLGDYESAVTLLDELLAEYPDHAQIWMNRAHALKTTGRYDESVSAYRRSIELQASYGEAYWSLANLKTLRFTDADLAAMRAQLERPDLSDEDRLHFEFALGKALEDRGEFAESFAHYVHGNEVRRAGIRYEADETTEHVRRSKALFTAEFFEERRGFGASSDAPIFIVGLPRSGSTLLEQILSSHSAVEGTMELPDMLSTARLLGGRRKYSDGSRYPEVLATLGADELRALGERYLAQTRVQRKTDAPRFIDKMPNNFGHIGLIHLTLPNAKIIDARRHPLACCFSNFKQHFARGQNFTYSLEEIGRYYRDYVELMAHFDAVLPGRVHRVYYEDVVEDLEREVRRLLEYCELPFEEGCIEYYRTERAVRTASSEQVRQPIFREGLDHWRNYEPWLDPLKKVLGSVLDCYPAAPQL